MTRYTRKDCLLPGGRIRQLRQTAASGASHHACIRDMALETPHQHKEASAQSYPFVVSLSNHAFRRQIKS
jgi:hypothetical protein